MTWRRLLELWALIVCDLHECFGVDVESPEVLTGRSWPWLRTRVLGLLSTESRLNRVLFPPPPPSSDLTG